MTSTTHPAGPRIERGDLDSELVWSGVDLEAAYNPLPWLRARGIADRPGNDDGTLAAQGYLIFDLMAGKRLGKLDLDLTINNLFNTDWRAAQFADASAVMPGAPVVEQMYFTPGIPLTATATAAYRF